MNLYYITVCIGVNNKLLVLVLVLVLEKDQFWETSDSEMQAVKKSERLVVAGDLNGDVGSDRIG